MIEITHELISNGTVLFGIIFAMMLLVYIANMMATVLRKGRDEQLGIMNKQNEIEQKKLNHLITISNSLIMLNSNLGKLEKAIAIR